MTHFEAAEEGDMYIFFPYVISGFMSAQSEVIVERQTKIGIKYLGNLLDNIGTISYIDV